MTYKFYVNLCGGSTGGELEVKARNYDSAYNKALELVGKKLYKAFPTLEIDYDIEDAEDYEEDEYD